MSHALVTLMSRVVPVLANGLPQLSKFGTDAVQLALQHGTEQ